MELNAMQIEAFLASLEKVIKDRRKTTRKECDKLAIEQLANDVNSNTLNITIGGVKVGTIRITDPTEEIDVLDDADFKTWILENHLGSEYVEEVKHFDVYPEWVHKVEVKDGRVIDRKTGEILDFLGIAQVPAKTRVYANTDGIQPAFAALGDSTMPQLLGGE